MELVTEQEKHWADPVWAAAYIERNRLTWSSRVPFWRDVIDLTQAKSVLEVGCSIGSNLKAIRAVDRQIQLTGVDISQQAVDEAWAAGIEARLMPASEIVDWFGPGVFDLVFTAGVLIHQNDEHLSTVMNAIIECSKRFVLAVEYESDHTEMVQYRGFEDRLWRRPYGKLYESAGLKMVSQFDAGEGFDRCLASLLEKA